MSQSIITVVETHSQANEIWLNRGRDLLFYRIQLSGEYFVKDKDGVITPFSSSSSGQSTVQDTYVAGENILFGRAFYIENELAYNLSSNDLSKQGRLVGISKQSVNIGEEFVGVSYGALGGMTLNDNKIYYLSTNGNITDVAPDENNEVLQPVGISLSTSKLFINPKLSINLI